MEKRPLQHSKTNWLSKICQPGYLLINALILVDLSFFIYQFHLEQRLTSVVIGAYLLLIVLIKYSNLKWLTCILICVASVGFLRNKQSSSLELIDELTVQVYPDQVNLKDGWMSAQASMPKGKILIAGSINKEQEALIKTGRSLWITKMSGEISKIEPATNLGEFDYQSYYRSQNISQHIKFKHCEIVFAPNNLMAKLHKIRFDLQEYFKQFPQLISFFASELILAENNSQDNQEILNNYRNLGVIHLLSISGLHVGIYVLVISTLCFWLKFTEDETFICCIAILMIEIFLSAGQAGFIRASLTYILGKIFSFKKWRIVGADLLGLTCLVHLLIVPKLFLGVGAQLSYILVLGLQLTNRLSPLKQSIALNLFLTPLLLFYFYQVNLLTVIFNLLIVPYFNWIVMPITFTSIALFKIFPQIPQSLETVLKFGEGIISQLSHFQFGMITFGKINWWECLLILLLSAAVLISVSELKPKVSWKLIGTLSASYMLFFCLIHFPLKGQVTFIDVGQGDSILITTPFPRKVYMIDTGGKLNFSGKKLTPQVNKITIPFLKAQGINKIDGLFVSHQDADHVGDLGPLMSEIQVDKLYMAQGLLTNPSFCKRIDGKIEHTKLVELLAGMQVKESQLTFNVVYPFKPGEGKNEDSLSLMFKLGGKSWLFTGDLGQDGEKELMNHFNFAVDYFKLGHHGSKTSSNPEFLEKLHPQMVFISAGRKNRFGHPHPETLATLNKLQIPWVSTQDCGMISWYYGKWTQNHFEKFLLKGDKQ